MIRPVLLSVLLLAAPVAAHAQRLASIKAGRLLQLCTNTQTRPACDAYLSGVGDGIAGVEHMMTREQGQNFAGATCIPQSTSAETLRSTVSDYLHAHRDALDKDAAVPVFAAYHAAFPCKAGG